MGLGSCLAGGDPIGRVGWDSARFLTAILRAAPIGFLCPVAGHVAVSRVLCLLLRHLWCCLLRLLLRRRLGWLLSGQRGPLEVTENVTIGWCGALGRTFIFIVCLTSVHWVLDFVLLHLVVFFDVELVEEDDGIVQLLLQAFLVVIRLLLRLIDFINPVVVRERLLIRALLLLVRARGAEVVVHALDPVPLQWRLHHRIAILLTRAEGTEDIHWLDHLSDLPARTLALFLVGWLKFGVQEGAVADIRQLSSLRHTR